VDPEKLSARGVSLLAVAHALKSNDALVPAGKTWGESEVYDVEVGGRLTSAASIENIAVGSRGGSIVRIRDIASVIDGPEEVTRASVLLDKSRDGRPDHAVSIVFAKRKGTNVVSLAEQLLKRAQSFSVALPKDVSMTEVRNYGSTAADKSKELIEHLLLATLSVTVLIALVMGLRASLVVATAIPVTLALTLSIYYFMGYTLNRVTLFALIFSIGILVDDAIVVVENIERHLKQDHRLGLVQATLRAVSEVGNPTILATFTVIAAILPMAFVRGRLPGAGDEQGEEDDEGEGWRPHGPMLRAPRRGGRRWPCEQGRQGKRMTYSAPQGPFLQALPTENSVEGAIARQLLRLLGPAVQAPDGSLNAADALA
jgi:multidrug efflux pump subunit AcrB